MKRILLLSVLAFLFYSHLFSQAKKENPGKTKLLVGIVVDQMRNEYIYRYWNRFGNGGFKRLISQGYYYRNLHFNYLPTYTGPGHASIYTGTTPRQHGIIGNDWYLKSNSTKSYCVQDSSVKPIGTKNNSGRMSPQHLLSSTLGDELKLSSPKSKVIGIALKDRSAILPAGHSADAAYWLDEVSGDFISSSWYMSDLPRWLKNFNDEHLAKSYLEKWWAPLYPIETYTASLADENKYEAVPNKKDYPVFPYEYKPFIEKSDYSIIKATPYGNSITKDIAVECIIKEELGKDEFIDLLCLSFSSSDIIGHAYGPRSVEVEDCYLRLDKDLEDLLNKLDKEVGKGNYLVFLSADHGGGDVPKHLMDQKIPAGYTHESKVLKEARRFLLSTYGDSLLLSTVMNEQLYLNEKRCESFRLNLDEVEEKLCRFLIGINGVAEAYPSKIMRYGSFEKNDIRTYLQNGYNFKLSGNVCYTLKPAWMDQGEKGTTHGSGYNYDTHVPLIFYGAGISAGENMNWCTIPQIAPSLSELLKINRPNSSSGDLLPGLFR
ncbi:MAG: alkaline phosphatase family protein [Bacteroidia bacterium]|nr:alkaline phosphatase family protein [Bacteroidia bacterium]